MAGLSTVVAPPDRVVPMRVVVCAVQRTGSLSMLTLSLGDQLHLPSSPLPTHAAERIQG